MTNLRSGFVGPERVMERADTASNELGYADFQ